MYFLKPGEENLSNFFFARKTSILATLNFLKTNHPDYSDIIIDQNLATDINNFDSSIFTRNNFFMQNLNSSNPSSSNHIEDQMHVSIVGRIPPPSDFSSISRLA